MIGSTFGGIIIDLIGFNNSTFIIVVSFAVGVSFLS